MKKILLMLMLVLVPAFNVCFTSCDDDDDAVTSELCGTWENDSFIYQFNSDGSGYKQYSPSNGAYEVNPAKSNFKWNATATVLSMTYDGSGPFQGGTITYYYEVDEDMLVLVNMNYGETSSYWRK